MLFRLEVSCKHWPGYVNWGTLSDHVTIICQTAQVVKNQTESANSYPDSNFLQLSQEEIKIILQIIPERSWNRNCEPQYSISYLLSTWYSQPLIAPKLSIHRTGRDNHQLKFGTLHTLINAIQRLHRTSNAPLSLHEKIHFLLQERCRKCK